MDLQSGLLARLMDATAMRQRVVSHNISNLNTPGYQRLEVDFESQLAKALNSTDPKSADFSQIEMQVHEVPGNAVRADGNSVDLDQEIGDLQRTAMLFQTYTTLLQSRIGMMHRAMESR
jgi:flagellar basal-body rod protein FlgB